MTLTRRRTKGRLGGEAEHFAMLPVSVMESEAVRTLDHAAFRVLAMVASGYRGWNNGTMAVTPRYAARFGMTSKDTLYKSLRELVRRGLLVETRQGWRGVKNHFALYAVAWADIHNREGNPLDTPEHCAPYKRRLFEWTGAPQSGEHDTAQIRTSDRGNSFPATGKGTAESFPVTGLHTTISVPATGNTSRYLGGVDGRPAVRFTDAPVIAKSETAITIADLMARARCSEADAHRALQRLQAKANEGLRDDGQ